MSSTLPIYRWLVPASAADDAQADHAKLIEAKRDPRLARVAWRDLMPLARWEVIDELALSLPWLAASLALAHFALWPAAMLCSFMFFLAALRQIHNGTHYALGIGRRGTEWFLFAMSIALLGSNHAVQYNHLRHHRHCLGPEDVEGVNARLSAWKVLLAGPVYPLMQHWWALTTSNPRMRRWVAAEIAANAVWIAAVCFVIEWRALQYHVAFMAAGHCFTAFFAVWTTHHDTREAPFPARTQKGWLKNWISYRMFLHVEHHLFPQVPTRHLARLAARLEAMAPGYRTRQVY
jgi:fatty acid desaturase